MAGFKTSPATSSRSEQGKALFHLDFADHVRAALLRSLHREDPEDFAHRPALHLLHPRVDRSRIWPAACKPLAWRMVALGIYAVGKTFFWPTMLAVASDRFPRTGAVAMSIMGGIGMLSAGLIGWPGLGYCEGSLHRRRTADKTDAAAYAGSQSRQTVQVPDIVIRCFGHRRQEARRCQKATAAERTPEQAAIVEAEHQGRSPDTQGRLFHSGGDGADLSGNAALFQSDRRLQTGAYRRGSHRRHPGTDAGLSTTAPGTLRKGTGFAPGPFLFSREEAARNMR